METITRRPAALFAKKQAPQLTTVEEALKVFADRLAMPETADYLRRIVAGGYTAKIDITAYRTADGSIGVHMDCASKLQHEHTAFKALK